MIRGRRKRSVEKKARKRKPLVLEVHHASKSSHELILSSGYFPTVKVGDVVELHQTYIEKLEPMEDGKSEVLKKELEEVKSTKDGKNGMERKNIALIIEKEMKKHVEKMEHRIQASILVKVSKLQKRQLKSKKKKRHHGFRVKQISLIDSIAKKFHFKRHEPIKVKLIMTKKFCSNTDRLVDVVELSLKNLFLSSIDQFIIREHIVKNVKVVFKGKTVRDHVTISAIYREGEEMKGGGIITNKTRFIFRSDSCEVYLLFVMSQEMWEHSNDGDIFFEKAINGFVKKLLTLWEKKKLNHLVRIVFFSRVQYKNIELLFHQNALLEKEVFGEKESISPFLKTLKEKGFVDFYKKVNLRGLEKWSMVLDFLKKEFIYFPQLVKERLLEEFQGHPIIENFLKTKFKKILSMAHNSPFFETINLLCNKYSSHHINRHLHHSGKKFIVISPGNGMFDVFEEKFEKLTKNRLINRGVLVDVIFLQRPPIHFIPLFRRVKKDRTVTYKIPKWIRVFFYEEKKLDDFDQRMERRSKKRALYVRVPRIRNMKGIKTVLPYLKNFKNPNPSNFEKHDLGVFSIKRVEKKKVKSKRKPFTKSPQKVQVKRSFDGKTTAVISPALGRSKELMPNSPVVFQDAFLQQVKKEEEKDYIIVGKLKNPFKYDSYAKLKERTKRYTHYFRRYGAMEHILNNIRKKKEGIENLFIPDWRSFCSPQLLVLESDYFPSSTMVWTVYQLTDFSDKDVNEAKSKLIFFKELIFQRIQSNFQFFLSDNEDYDQEYKLSILDQFHRISRTENGVKIEIVKTQKKAKEKEEAYERDYEYYLWDDCLDGFHTKKASFRLPPPFRWNDLDTIICGLSSKTFDIDLSPRVLQYHLIPIKDWKPINLESTSTVTQQQRLAGVLRMFNKKYFRLSSHESGDLKILLIDEKNIEKYKNRDAVLFKYIKLIDDTKYNPERFEFIRLFYKTNYNANETYPFMIKWFCSNAVSIGGWTSFLRRAAAKLGFLLVKTPFFPTDVTDKHKGSSLDEDTEKEKQYFLHMRSFSSYVVIDLPVNKTVEVLRAICEEMGFYSEIYPITNHSKRLINAEGSTILQVEKNNKLLYIDNFYERRTPYNCRDRYLKICSIVDRIRKGLKEKMNRLMRIAKALRTADLEMQYSQELLDEYYTKFEEVSNQEVDEKKTVEVLTDFLVLLDDVKKNWKISEELRDSLTGEFYEKLKMEGERLSKSKK